MLSARPQTKTELSFKTCWCIYTNAQYMYGSTWAMVSKIHPLTLLLFQFSQSNTSFSWDHRRMSFSAMHYCK